MALVVMARYLARNDPNLRSYLSAALTHAEASKLASGDLTMLRTLVGAVGGPQG